MIVCDLATHSILEYKFYQKSWLPQKYLYLFIERNWHKWTKRDRETERDTDRGEKKRMKYSIEWDRNTMN